MVRALFIIALIIAVVVAGLMLLRRTKDVGVPKHGDMPRKRIRGPDEKDDDEDDRGW